MIKRGDKTPYKKEHMTNPVTCINFCMQDTPEAWADLALFKARYESTGDDLADSFSRPCRDYDLEAELTTGDVFAGICHM